MAAGHTAVVTEKQGDMAARRLQSILGGAFALVALVTCASGLAGSARLPAAMELHLLDGAAGHAHDASCLDGTPAGFYVLPSNTSTQWVISLQVRCCTRAPRCPCPPSQTPQTHRHTDTQTHTCTHAHTHTRAACPHPLPKIHTPSVPFPCLAAFISAAREPRAAAGALAPSTA